MAHIGIGTAKGDEKAIEAVKMAVASPLLETTINGASHVIINISGDISLMDANDAASYVQDLAGDDANIIFGAKYDESMTDEATITVIATGLEENARPAAPKTSASAVSSVYNNMRYTTQQSGANSGVTAQSAYAGRTAASTQTASSANAAPTPTFSGIQKPVQPSSTVKQVEINIPDFLKNSKR